MARFAKGTTDHDGDGRMGGSRKEGDDMATEEPIVRKAREVASRRTKTTAADTPEAKATVPEKVSAAKEQFAEADASGDPVMTPEQARQALAIRGY